MPLLLLPSDRMFVGVVLNPQAKIVQGYSAPVLMPTFQGQVSEDQLLQLIEYIKSLSGEAAEADTAAAGVGP